MAEVKKTKSSKGKVSSTSPSKGKAPKKEASSQSTTSDSPPAKAAKVPDKVIDPAKALTVANIPKLPAAEACAQAKSLYANIEKNYVRFAALMYHIRTNDLYKEKYGTWKDYVETEFNHSVRVAQEKVTTFKTLFIEGGITPKDLEQVGHTKANHIASAINKGSLDAKQAAKWVEKAKTLTEKELKSSLKGKAKPKDKSDKPGTEGEKNVTLDVNARLSGESAVQLFQATIEKMEKVEGRELAGHEVIERLCLEYQASTIDKADSPLAHILRVLREHHKDKGILCVQREHYKEVLAFAQNLIKTKKADKAEKPAKE